ncbi:hypothetical protein T11_15013 [Trichinella zimbabwensis]|uniref:Uncharacterized protein n=1 Tax=Trichinella zimbabwensis TaxID=268475 RepID=A0A0V1I5N1_9BILA|nr:hypothetical protein T11_15013 [Trichinella zimbabwensis]
MVEFCQQLGALQLKKKIDRGRGSCGLSGKDVSKIYDPKFRMSEGSSMACAVESVSGEPEMSIRLPQYQLPKFDLTGFKEF